jgi:hypothetical protein
VLLDDVGSCGHAKRFEIGGQSLQTVRGSAELTDVSFIESATGFFEKRRAILQKQLRNLAEKRRIPT